MPNPLFTTESEDNDIQIVKTLKDVAADLMRGDDPQIVAEDYDTCREGYEHAFDTAKEMLIELINSAEFQTHHCDDIDRRIGKAGLSFRVEG